MEAGRELDALVAKKVMGFKVKDYGEDSYYYLSPKGTCGLQCENHEHIVPYYSTDIAAAWEVVEKLDFRFHIIKSTEKVPNLFRPKKEKYVVLFCPSYEGDEYEIGAETAPHAICLAALNAVGITNV